MCPKPNKTSIKLAYLALLLFVAETYFKIIEAMPPLQMENDRFQEEKFGTIQRSLEGESQASKQYHLPLKNQEDVLSRNLDYDDELFTWFGDKKVSNREIEDYRLPNKVVPTHYRLFLRPVLDNGSDFRQFSAPGNVTITIICIQETSKIVLHTKKIDVNIDNVVLKDLGGDSIVEVSGYAYNNNTEMLTIYLCSNLTTGRTYELFIPFTSYIDADGGLQGMYLSYYEDTTGGGRRNLVATQNEPTGARMIFPCFDEPKTKATFEMSIARRPDFNVLTNSMKLRSQLDPEFPNWIWDHFKISPWKMSTYLLAIIISDFPFIDAPNLEYGSLLRVYGPPSYIAEKGGDYAAGIIPTYIEYFEKFTGINLPVRKLDFVALPQLAPGAMENWGLITSRLSLATYMPGEDTETQRKKVTDTIVHELAHQWFGDLVTCKWWSNTWLNEGFARYSQYRAAEMAWADSGFENDFVSSSIQPAMIADQGPQTHPMIRELRNAEEIVRHFSPITYNKGAALLRMLEGVLTTKVFDASVRDYLQANAGSSVTEMNLFDSMQKYGKSLLPKNVTVHRIMESWMSESGYPLVRVTIADKNAVYLSQEEFQLRNGSVYFPGNNRTWFIPVKIVCSNAPNSSDRRPSTWIETGKSVIKYTEPGLDTQKWIIVNPDVTGYYRVLYDKKLLQLIKAQLMLNASVFSPATRAQLLDDYFYFSDNGYSPIESILELTDYLHHETKLVVWSQVFYHLRFICTRFSTDEAAFNNFKNYFGPKMAAVLDEIGWEQTRGEKGDKVILRAQLLDFVCTFQDIRCTDYARRLFHAWHPVRNRIFPDVRAISFCTAAAHGGQDTWEKAFEFYRQESSETTKVQFFKALACATEEATIARLLELSLNKTAGLDVINASLYLSGSSVGRQLAYTILKQKFDEPENTAIGPCDIVRVFSIFSEYWNQRKDIDDLNQFTKMHRKRWNDSHLQVLKQSVKKIRDNMEWFNRVGNPFSSWFAKRLST